MKFNLIKLLVLLAITGFVRGHAEEKLATLHVGSEIYSNVTVTTVTPTDIYFNHAKGMGNAKLKLLSPELQKQFRFDATNSAAIEKAQAEATTNFLRHAATNHPVARPTAPDREEVDEPTEDANGELVASKLYATSFRGQRPPQIIVDEWLTPPPEVTNKFVLVEFWATWAEPARETIPHLNQLQTRFKDQLVVLGLSNEPVEEIRKMTAPSMQYSVGTDTQGRTWNALQVRALPHCLLIDPSGIVRYEGHSKHLDAAHLEKLIARYVD